jgi:hypothetical protein
MSGEWAQGVEVRKLKAQEAGERKYAFMGSK